ALKWGGVLAALNIGQIAGNLIALRWRPRRLLFTARIIEIAQAPLLIALALQAPLSVIVSLAVLAGVGITLPDSLWYTALQTHLPEAALSRVASYDWMGSLALRPVG